MRDPRTFLEPCTPDRLAAFVVALCELATIRGSADPMYIANVTAFEADIGTGRGDFLRDLDHLVSDAALVRIATRLARSYQSRCTESGVGIPDILRLLRAQTRSSSPEATAPA